MTKPIEVGQRVSIRINGKLFGRGALLAIRTDLSNTKYQISLDGGGQTHVTLENLRILKPKPKRVCHCNREPDRWVLFNPNGSYTLSIENKKEVIAHAQKYGVAHAQEYGVAYERAIAPLWIGSKEEVK